MTHPGVIFLIGAGEYRKPIGSSRLFKLFISKLYQTKWYDAYLSPFFMHSKYISSYSVCQINFNNCYLKIKAFIKTEQFKYIIMFKFLYILESWTLCGMLEKAICISEIFDYLFTVYSKFTYKTIQSDMWNNSIRSIITA